MDGMAEMVIDRIRHGCGMLAVAILAFTPARARGRSVIGHVSGGPSRKASYYVGADGTRRRVRPFVSGGAGACSPASRSASFTREAASTGG